MNSIEIVPPLNSVPPYKVYVCDGFGNNCFFLALLQDNNPTNMLYLPPQFNNAPVIIVKIIDGINCVTEKTYFCGVSNPEVIEIIDGILFDGGYLLVGDNYYLMFS